MSRDRAGAAPGDAVDSFPRRHARTRRFTLGVPRDIRVAADGSRVLFLRSAAGDDPVNALWVLDIPDAPTPAASGDGARLVADPSVLGADDPDLPPAERARRERTREAAGGIVGYDADARLEVAVFVLGGELWRADVTGGGVEPLGARAGAFDPRLSPDGERVAYVAGSTLRLVDADGDRLLVGEDEAGVTWGSAEFVAAEEMGRTRGHWWAPDGSGLLAARVDVSGVNRWWIASPVDPARPPTEIRYPAAGTANAVVDLALVDLDGSRRPVGWREAGSADWEYLAGVRWDDEGLLLTVQTRDQRTLGVLEVEATTGACREVHRVDDEAWVELVAGVPRRHRGRLVTVADRGDARRVVVDGEALTGDGLQVRRVVGVDAEGVTVTASFDDPTSIHVVRVAWDGGTEVLTPDPGVHTAVIGGPVTVVQSRTLDDDEVVTLVRRGDEVIGHLDSHAAASGLDVDVTLVRTGSRRLATALVLPSDPRRRRGPLPVLLDPYGGPHAQRVLRSRAAFHVSQWFADQGFAVVVVDGRGTPGRGPVWEKAVHGDLAGPVLDDQLDALTDLLRHDERLDPTRVAIRGWSFGGYLAALAVLRRPDLVHAAVAGAPVTDWRLYDTHYTERYLGHPASDPAAYERTDLTAEAARLERPLLLIHGLADDNVVAAHTLALSRALLEAGRSHAVLPLSDVTHMTPQEAVAENLLVLQRDFLRRAL
ncbi:MAG: S9 family peptidase, partial [Actinomyces sp.]